MCALLTHDVAKEFSEYNINIVHVNLLFMFKTVNEFLVSQFGSLTQYSACDWRFMSGRVTEMDLWSGQLWIICHISKTSKVGGNLL